MRGKLYMNLRSVVFLCVRSLCVLCMIVAAGCGSQTQMPVSAPISVAISPQSAAIGTGQTTRFTLVTNDPMGVTLSATAGTIDNDTDDYTAPSGPQSATVTVTATSKKDPTKSASAKV